MWLNTPIRPHEASGTSGMKPPMHLGVNCSILDGWWRKDLMEKWIRHRRYAPALARQLVTKPTQKPLCGLGRRTHPRILLPKPEGLPTRWMKRALRSAATVPGVQHPPHGWRLCRPRPTCPPTGTSRPGSRNGVIQKDRPAKSSGGQTVNPTTRATARHTTPRLPKRSSPQ